MKAGGRLCLPQAFILLTFLQFLCILIRFQPLSRASLKASKSKQIKDWEFLLRPAVTCLYKELSFNRHCAAIYVYGQRTRLLEINKVYVTITL